MSGLEITDLHKRFGEHPVLTGLDLAARSGSFTAVLGASGSGKTTLLRLLAGFERPDRGTIRIGEQIVDGEDRHVRPEQRRIGYVPQEGTLFPHLSVEANIGFGLRRAARRRQVGELLDLVGLTGFAQRYPHQLSGGQQQRVALARALAVAPAVVLLDEPFASLDSNLRASVREEVQTILRASGTTAVLVTHDQDEALSLADHIAVLRNGTIAQFAPPQDVYAAPIDGDLASFIGVANLIEGTFADGLVHTPLGKVAALPQSEPLPAGCTVTVLVRPEQIEVGPAGPGSDLTGRIARSGYHGHTTLLHVETVLPQAGRHLIVRTQAGAGLPPGTEVGLTIRGPAHIWPAQPGPPSQTRV